MLQRIDSEKNGHILVRSSWMGTEVWVDDYDQTSRYTNTMWRMALSHIPPTAHIKRVLLLGLGAGGIIPLLARKFPSCHVTALEWDDAMIALAKKNIHSDILSRVEIIPGDAKTTLSALSRTFDCIILDLFCGKKVSPVISDRVAVSSLQTRLKANGYLLANFFEEPGVSSLYEEYFSRERSLRYRYNALRVFRPFGSGIVGSPLPDGYLPYRMCRGYMERVAANQRATTIIGSDTCPGYRTQYGSFAIDKFFGDNEPDCSEKGARLACWRPFTRTDAPKGWLQTPLAGNIGLTGFSHVQEEYWKQWDSHAQRHRLKWLKQQEWRIEEVSLSEFLSAYYKTKKELTLKKLFGVMLKRKVRGHGSRVRLIGVRRTQEGAPIEAGFASLTIPESHQAVHLISFIHDRARNSSAGVAMMNDWFAFGLANDLQYLDFGLFWRRGEPKSWKPWSNFKGQFGIHYLMHPDPLLKMIWK